jgi:hypothetical protein
MNYVIDWTAWFVAMAILMSFIEHQIHQKMMHRKHFLSKYIQAVKKVFEHHATLHHGHYSTIFSDKRDADRKDKGIRLSLLEGFIEALPISALLAIISLPGAIIFEVVVCFHHIVWNAIHMEMHKREARFFSEWPIYKFLARHHYLHHRHPDKNFNVVFPVADYVLGSNVRRPTRSDLKGMLKSGLW